MAAHGVAAPRAGESRALRIGLACLVVAAAVAAFANGIDGAWVWDDASITDGNPHLKSLVPTAELWATPLHGFQGRPVVAFSFALNYAISEFDPRSYHVLNVAIHAAAALALYGIVRVLLRRPAIPARWAARAPWLAASIAVLWAVHPLHTSAVTYVVQRCESLMGMLMLFGVYAALRSFEGRHERPWQACAVAAGVLAALTKESAVALPLVVLLLDAASSGRRLGETLRARRGFYSALALVWGVVGVVLALGSSFRGTGDPRTAGLDGWANLKLQAWAIVHYLRLAFWPRPLVLDHGWPIPERVAEWLPHGLLVIALVGASALGFARRSVLAAVGLCFFVLLAPTSSFVPIPTEPVAEWRMYAPLACVVAVSVLGVARLIEPLARAARAAIASVAVAGASIALGWVSIERNREFADALGLWRIEVQRVPENHRTWYNLAEVARVEGSLRESLAAYDRACELLPEFGLYYHNRAFVAAELGDVDTAMRHYRRAIELQPLAVLPRNQLAKLLLLRGDATGAEALFREAAALEPDDATARCGIGRALVARGLPREALPELRRAVELAPRMLPALEPLVLLLATSSDDALRDPAAALALAERALADRAEDPPALSRLLAAALAASGRHAEAAERAAQALAVARARGSKRLTAALERELAAYRAGETPRDVQP